MSNITIRKIEEKDNARVEFVIRSCLIEFGANHEGTAWADKNLGNFSNVYNSEGNAYFVALVDDIVVAGSGIGHLTDDICELQKMYCLPEYRGLGISQKLMDECLTYAKKYYKKCYLETLDNMTRAIKFYERNGFQRIYEPVVNTGHFSCDVRYIKQL